MMAAVMMTAMLVAAELMAAEFSGLTGFLTPAYYFLPVHCLISSKLALLLVFTHLVHLFLKFLRKVYFSAGGPL